ncbi:antitoxin Xre-like helix-turn-helix domain-containing protein [Enterovirga sp. GCM10030262]|uniref:antitoxin Xre-like helix-turn-helix domain-containing protein n=1 Tax=Enterovirga sp. GCM10030262 TaxID=3273391 RepID=UPI0036084331
MTTAADRPRRHLSRAGVMKTMKDIGAAWSLSMTEQAHALGVSEATWSTTVADRRSPLPPGTCERAGYLWNLRSMLSELSRDGDAQGSFLRSPGILGRPSPLARLTSDKASLKALCAEIDAIAGEGICPEPFAWSLNDLPAWVAQHTF